MSFSATYVKEMAKAYARRGENCQFEVHQLPDVSDEEFLDTIAKYGMKKSSGVMAGAPRVHFVVWDEESEYYQRKLKPLVDEERKRRAEEIAKYIEGEKKKLREAKEAKEAKASKKKK